MTTYDTEGKWVCVNYECPKFDKVQVVTQLASIWWERHGITPNCECGKPLRFVAWDRTDEPETLSY